MSGVCAWRNGARLSSRHIVVASDALVGAATKHFLAPTLIHTHTA
jgi:hypothetical protein